jgi:initiation factor 1A
MVNRTKTGKFKRKRIAKRGTLRKPDVNDNDASYEYGQVSQILGNRRLLVLCYDGITRVCKIRNSMNKKKMNITLGDILLICIRELDHRKADVLWRLDDNDIKKLRKRGRIPETLLVDDGNSDNEQQIMFDSSSDDEDKDDELSNKSELNIEDIWDDI